MGRLRPDVGVGAWCLESGNHGKVIYIKMRIDIGVSVLFLQLSAQRVFATAVFGVSVTSGAEAVFTVSKRKPRKETHFHQYIAIG